MLLLKLFIFSTESGQTGPVTEGPTLKSKKTPILCWSEMGFESISSVC